MFELKNLTIADSVRSIGEYAFRKTSLAEVNIPESVSEIAAAAFIMYCKESAEVRGFEILFIILAGAVPAMLFEKV